MEDIPVPTGTERTYENMLNDKIDAKTPKKIRSISDLKLAAKKFKKRRKKHEGSQA